MVLDAELTEIIGNLASIVVVMSTEPCSDAMYRALASGSTVAARYRQAGRAQS
jgi:hypothetical protein